MNKKRAFTLIELLVVIVIISILGTLVTFAVNGAMRAAKRTRIATEMSQVTFALEMYKKEFGEYPPDFYDDAALVRHVKKRWPRFELPGVEVHYQALSIRQAISNVYRSFSQELKQQWTGSGNPNFNFMPDNTNIVALGFWLGGFPNQEGKYAGFSADPEAPFGKRADGTINIIMPTNPSASPPIGTPAGFYNDVVLGTQDKKTFIELEIFKNIVFVGQQDGVFPCLTQKVSSNQYVPFVYFRGTVDGDSNAYLWDRTRSGTKDDAKYYDFTDLSGQVTGTIDWIKFGVAIAYVKSGDPFNTGNLDGVVWANSSSYQLIHPGLDAYFGMQGTRTTDDPFNDSRFRSLNTSAAKNTFGQADLDNITNFSDFNTIQSIFP
jgi:prepilin-type N-terminal cleavage/methylation domain-containing protein